MKGLKYVARSCIEEGSLASRLKMRGNYCPYSIEQMSKTLLKKGNAFSLLQSRRRGVVLPHTFAFYSWCVYTIRRTDRVASWISLNVRISDELLSC